MSLWRIFRSWMCFRPRQIWTNQSTIWETHSSVFIFTEQFLTPMKNITENSHKYVCTVSDVVQFPEETDGVSTTVRTFLHCEENPISLWDTKARVGCTCSSVKETPLCMLIFFIRSPPSQYSIIIYRLPLSIQICRIHLNYNINWYMTSSSPGLTHTLKGPDEGDDVWMVHLWQQHHLFLGCFFFPCCHLRNKIHKNNRSQMFYILRKYTSKLNGLNWLSTFGE